MIRQPSDSAQLYAWHSAALLVIARYGDFKSAPRFGQTGIAEYDGLSGIQGDDPQCGWFKRRLVKDGPWVPARIWLEQKIDQDGELTAPEILRCEVDGRPRDPHNEWTWLAARPIGKKEFEYMTDLRSWQRANAPRELTVAGAIDHTKTPLPF